MKVQFKLERETKNTFRFFELNEQGEEASLDEYVIGTLYVQKSIFNGKKPQELNITLHLDGEEED